MTKWLEISLISKSSDPVNRTVEVWVNLGNEAGKLKANGAAQVIVNAQSPPAMRLWCNSGGNHGMPPMQMRAP